METIKQFKMVEAGDSILISVSGGPDSVFLTYILNMLRKSLGLELYGFSLDHSTRDGQSGKDLQFVRGLYKDLEIKLFPKKVDASEWCRKHNLSFQEGARKLRSDLLREIASENNIRKIALGHNLDDNIETFLMRVIRGSGAKGLAGIRPVNGCMIRPLINTPRQDIEDYLNANNIGFCMDRSNLEDKYLRNRIRNRLIPFIKDNFPGDLAGSVKRTMEILRDEDIFLRQYSSDILGRTAVFKESSDGKKTIYIRIPITSLRSGPYALRRRIILAALEKIMGSLVDISYRNIEDILGLVETDSGENKWLSPISSVMVFRIGEDIHMADTGFTGEMDPDIQRYMLERSGMLQKEGGSPGQAIKIGGYTGLEDFPFSVMAKRVSDPGDYRSLPYSRAVLDYKKVLPPVIVRTWRKGDRFYPLGMEGSKKLQDFFIDNKVPVNMRKNIPVFCDSEKVIWVGNMRIDSRVRATSATTDFLCLELFEN